MNPINLSGFSLAQLTRLRNSVEVAIENARKLKRASSLTRGCIVFVKPNNKLRVGIPPGTWTREYLFRYRVVSVDDTKMTLVGPVNYNCPKKTKTISKKYLRSIAKRA